MLYGFVDHDVTTTYLGSTHRAAAAARAADRATGAAPARPPTCRHSAWVGGATRDFRDVDAGRMRRRARAPARLVATHASTSPPGRYDTVLPPTAVADLMIYAYWIASARTAHDGQSVYAHPGGGTRIGEPLSRRPVQVFSDPAYARLRVACRS